MDATWVGKVKTDQAQEDWYDELSPIGVSLILRVSKTGRKVWAARYRPRGEKVQRRFKLGEYPAMPLSEARERVSGIHAGLSEGADPSGEREEWKASPTFGKLAEEYVERWAKKRKRSWEEDERIIKHDLKVWENKKAQDIQKKDVTKLLDAIVERGAPIQANRTLAVARRIFNWGMEEDIVKANPCYKVKARGVETKRDRVLSEDEIKRVWAAFEALAFTEEGKASASGAVVRDILMIRLLTAQRGGEVMSMRWQDLDLDGGWWTIPAEVAKNGLSHRVPLSEPVRAILKARQAKAEEKSKKSLEESEADAWVFPARGEKVEGPITEIKKSAARARKLSGCDWVPHDLRRTAASHMAGMGIQRLVISKILNHVESGVTAVYERHSYDAEKRLALDAWAMKLAEIVATEQNPSTGSKSRMGSRQVV